MQTITVNTGRPYEVLIGRGLLAKAGELTARVHKPCTVAIVSDETVAGIYLEQVKRSFQSAGFRTVDYVFPAGEHSKNMGRLADLLDFLAQSELGRSDLIVALGGGVTGDLAGFAAASFQRGIGYVQLPTTLLAAVDSSVGGKTAVNLPSGKNLAGAFWQPEAVICDCDTFATLPGEELSAGGAECVKYAMLCDSSLLDLITEKGLTATWEDIVAPCVEYKAKVVAEDEKEHGVRKLLNLGHTVGHAAERLSGYSIRHGEGVAIGMMVLTLAAEKKGICARGVTAKLEAALQSLHLPTVCPYKIEDIAKASLGDKKRQGDSITLVLPRDVGDCFWQTIKTSEMIDWVRLGMEE